MDPYQTLVLLLRAIEEMDWDMAHYHIDSLIDWNLSSGYLPAGLEHVTRCDFDERLNWIAYGLMIAEQNHKVYGC